MSENQKSFSVIFNAQDEGTVRSLLKTAGIKDHYERNTNGGDVHFQVTNAPADKAESFESLVSSVNPQIDDHSTAIKFEYT